MDCPLTSYYLVCWGVLHDKSIIGILIKNIVGSDIINIHRMGPDVGGGAFQGGLNRREANMSKIGS